VTVSRLSQDSDRHQTLSASVDQDHNHRNHGMSPLIQTVADRS
jgi:hypothetical protein